MLLPVSVLRSKLHLKVHKRWAALAKVSEEDKSYKISLLWKKQCLKFIKNLTNSSKSWKIITEICRTWNLPFRMVNYGFLQTRNGKRTGAAMVKIAMDMLEEGMIIEERSHSCVLSQINWMNYFTLFLIKMLLASARVLAKGLPASPGAATGQIVFLADEAEDMG